MEALTQPVDLFLQPGEYAVAGPGTRVHTLLGSCVSVTLWHPRLRVGAMSHFLLSARGSGRGPLDARYAGDAITLMVLALGQRGARVEECEAKLFGGGNMFPNHAAAAKRSVGQRNGEAARMLLESRGIPIVSESLYGNGHRRIIFELDTGSVWSRQIDPASRIEASEGK